MTADPSVLKNLLRCPGLTVMQTAALNTLLANGKTQIGWVGFLRISLGGGGGPGRLEGFLPSDKMGGA